MKKLGIYILSLYLLISCEEVTEWDQETEFVPRLVVEGFITNNPELNYVKLSLPITQQGQKPLPVSDARVFVSDGENYLRLIEDDDSGIYYPEDDVRAVVNKIYYLLIEIGEYNFTAGAAMLPVGPQGEFSYIQVDEQEDLYKINPENGSDPSMTRYIVEWEEEDRPGRSVFYHYRLNTADVNEFFKPASETLVFPGNARIIRQKYSLSPDHQNYIRGMLSETEWKGGWFDVLPGNLNTNISRGGAGFFAASSVLTDTVYFE